MVYSRLHIPRVPRSGKLLFLNWGNFRHCAVLRIVFSGYNRLRSWWRFIIHLCERETKLQKGILNWGKKIPLFPTTPIIICEMGRYTAAVPGKKSQVQNNSMLSLAEGRWHTLVSIASQIQLWVFIKLQSHDQLYLIIESKIVISVCHVVWLKLSCSKETISMTIHLIRNLHHIFLFFVRGVVRP